MEEEVKENKKFYITETEIILEPNNQRETPLMNMVNDVGLKITGDDLSVLNVGGFRTTWYPGSLNEIDMLDMSPFPSFFVTFEMTGEEVIKMLNTIQNRKNLYPTGGIKQNFKKDSNGNNKLIDVKLFESLNESSFNPKQRYVICTSDYLANGGSAMNDVLEWYQMKNRKNYPKTAREYLSYSLFKK